MKRVTFIDDSLSFAGTPQGEDFMKAHGVTGRMVMLIPRHI